MGVRDEEKAATAADTAAISGGGGWLYGFSVRCCDFFDGCAGVVLEPKWQVQL